MNNENMYNKKNLHIDNKNTLIIIDWDDTLHPTTWVTSNNIDLTDPNSRYKYIKYYEKLDHILSDTLTTIIKYGEVIIITNAMLEWIDLTLGVLPKTKDIILNNIQVVSAREKYQNKTKMTSWKEYAFLEEILRRSQMKKYVNILSLGDAEFEHNALINLYNLKILPHKYLKSIKFIKSEDYNLILDQIKMIKKNIKSICLAPRHLDLTFDNN